MKAWPILLLGALWLTPVCAQDKPADLDALLEQVRESQRATSEVNKKREQRFINNKQEQARLLREARERLAPIEQRAKSLQARYDSNAAEIRELKETLDERAGDVTQIFTVVRQFAGDLRATARDSLVTAQFPERLEFLGRVAESDDLPSLEVLEQLWYTAQQAMTENGKVVSFPTQITGAEGVTEQGVATRVGVFTAVADGRYLRWVPGAGLQVLQRQPGWHEQGLAEDLEAAEAGVVPMIVDPTRGSILGLLVEQPSLAERINQGGLVGYVIIVLAALGLILAGVQLVYLFRVGRDMDDQLNKIGVPRSDNPLGRVLSSIDERDIRDLETLELKLDEAVLKERPALERGQAVIKLLAAVAPLLGLLGTVVGMIATFQAITLFGTGDPKLMAGGISQALVTTVLGLIAAVPLLFAHSIMATRSRSLIQILDEQSAGLLARQLEKRRQPE